MLKRLLCILISIVFLVLLTAIPISAYTPTNFEVSAEGAMLVNLDSGDILYKKNIDKKLYPASLTKLMTALILYESTNDLDSETITVSENALKILQGTGSSVGGLKAGETLTVRQMLNVLLISSANDGANAIAEHISGTIDGFVEKMNTKAQELGMNNTSYANPHGLHDENHYTTVNDMYLLSKAFLSVDLLKEISYTTKYKLPATNLSSAKTFTTTNLLMLNNGMKCDADKYKGQAYYYRYGKGVKTGYTDKAGRCLISTASKNGYNYLCIIMNSPVKDDSGKNIRIEFGDSKALYEWAFKDFEYKNVMSNGEIIGEAKVELSMETDHVSACPSEGLSAIVPKALDSSSVSTEIRWYKESYDAPIKKGDILGECDVIYAGEVIDTVTLVATSDIDRNMLLYAARSVKRFFSNRIVMIILLIILAIAALVTIIFVAICMIINSPKKRRRRRY